MPARQLGQGGQEIPGIDVKFEAPLADSATMKLKDADDKNATCEGRTGLLVTPFIDGGVRFQVGRH